MTQSQMMHSSITRRWKRLCALTVLTVISCAGPGGVATEAPTLEIKNFRRLAPGVVGGGQVDVSEFQIMADGGYTLVVNLRQEGEAFPADEGKLAEQAGMGYLHLPMGGNTLVAENADQLAAALDEFGSGFVLVHCASGNRVGALWGLHTAIQQNADPQQGVALAQAAGMRSDSLAACVRAALTPEPAAPFGFRAWGSMREVLRNGETQGRVDLAALSGSHLIGVGALAGLSGELTIDKGIAHVAAVSGDGVTFPTPASDAQATLLALAEVSTWNEITLPAIANLEELEDAVIAAASQAGIDATIVPTMPFRVEGTFENLCLHVLNGSCPIADPDGPEPWRLTDATAEGVLVGFFAADAAGKLTHHGQRSHVHAIAITSEGQQAGGHVDSTGIAAGAKLFVPASK